MKKLIYVLSIALLLASCKDEPKDYATLSGKIINKNSDSLIVTSRDYHKKIKVNSDGTFSDTLKIETGRYKLFDGIRPTNIYLENGYDLEISLDAQNFNEPPVYKGVGADINNYFLEKRLLENEIALNTTMFDLDKSEFEQKLKEIENSYKTLLGKIKNADSTFVKDENSEIENRKIFILNKYEDKQYFKTFLARGMPSPKFVDYENFNGKNTSLTDLKGKYAYIVFWSAKRNNMYKKETPYLNMLENEYLGKNITFVSISIDRKKDYEIWKQMVIAEKLRGIQLFANGDKSFADDYGVKGTIRFILIDPQGNIVSANAPRPSSNNLKVLFEELKI